MGYTNYWNNVKGSFFQDRLLENVKKLIKESGIKICGPGGTGEPIITDSKIAFNGDASTNDDYETFALTINDDFDCCKTAHRPYDVVVKAVLMLAYADGCISGYSWDGNSGDPEYKAAIGLINKVFNNAK